MTKPSIVLVPGAWHTPTPYDPLITALESHAYKVYTVHLPSVSTTSSSSTSSIPIDFGPDIAALRSCIAEAIGEEGNDVLVVVHSWGGLVAQSALDGEEGRALSRKEREARGEKGGVVKCAYMAAFMVEEGVSLMEMVGGTVPEWWGIDGPHAIIHNPAVFVSDLPASSPIRSSYASNVHPHAYSTFTSKTTGASWKNIPTSYLLCEEDQVIPSFAQYAMSGMVKDSGAEIEMRKVKSGHSPWLSVEEEVVRWVRGVAGEDV